MNQNREAIIHELSEWHRSSFREGIKSFLDEVSTAYEEQIREGGDRVSIPFCFNLKIDWYNAKDVDAPFIFYHFLYDENVGLYGATAGCLLTGPPDCYEIPIEQIPDEILITALNKIKSQFDKIAN